MTIRRAFLLYPLASRAARVLRLGIYVSVSLAVLTVGSIIDYILITGGGPLYWEEDIYITYTTSRLILISVLTATAMMLRFAAGYAESRSSHGPYATLRDALLLRRFNRRTANIVRIAYYVLLVLAAVYLFRAVRGMLEDWVFVTDAAWCVVVVGWAVVLCYWAVSLESRQPEQRGGEASSSD